MNKFSPYVIWLTQPRMSLGINQDQNSIAEIYSKMPSNSYLVIDEAAEQLFPSHLCNFNSKNHPCLIKIKNFYKGMGINGIRLSFIAHESLLQQDMQRELENFQGAIDYFSLLTTTEFSKNINQYKTMLDIANQQTKSLRLNLSRRYGNDSMELSKLVNGYVGTLSLNFNKLPFHHLKNRENLLNYCFENGVSIM